EALSVAPQANASPTASPTATPTATPSGPSPTPSRTPTYTPISYTPTPAFLIYTVRQGDTLSEIARRYNTTVSAIMDLNSLRSDMLSIGQELLIPGQRSTSNPEAPQEPTYTPSGATQTPTPTATSTPATSSPSPTAAQLSSVAPPGAASLGRGLVVAFYYTWYGLDQWAAGKVPDIPAVPYASSDRNTIVRHVEQARGAGIDAFAVAWYGPQASNNQTETNFRVLLDVAAERGFHCTVDFETRSPFYRSQADIVAALRHLVNNHAAHPAFLRSGGKPLIFFWAVKDVFTGQGQSAIDAWASIRQQVDPEHNTLWIADGANIDFLRVFDGHHLYNITWSPPANVNNTLSTWGDRVRNYSSEHGTSKLWAATVMPGYNDLFIQGRTGRFSHDRRGGAYYRETWEAAVNSAPDLVVITSFNEWLEGTQIEPSVSYGNLYLDLTAELSAAYKRGQ
ncbi:MAG: endo-1,3-alpha-glucanase family glycosylhydrolase, partial [Anaerolineae bacterium]|nr:endo-1,3-alpha-glucanase family glycosylhydrolase [Anaerolineae bacterium]